jgi:hypothetical protein
VWGACLAAAIFSNIGQMLNKTDQATQRYQGQLDKVREFGKLYKLPKELRQKLSGYNELLFAVSRGYDTSSIAAMFPQVRLRPQRPRLASAVGRLLGRGGGSAPVLGSICALSLHLPRFARPCLMR